jgi:Kef-type K+ transport system membrane component KefB
MPFGLPQEILYVALLFALLVVPKLLQRWRLPSAVTSVGLGAAAGLGFGVFGGDTTIQLLASFGIVALFLFAGLEVDFDELRQGRAILAQHVALRFLALTGVAWGATALFGLSWRPATLVALALLTPSTGFILDSLAAMGLRDRERFWVKSKAIATEIVALAVLFVVLQSTSLKRLAMASAILVGLIALLPVAFRYFAQRVVPYAPKSEFAFLMMLALVAALVTRQLGVYYLVGAFIVGVAAQRFREQLPAMASEQMLHAVEVFASVFVPFYFFSAGLHLTRDDFGPDAALVGFVFLTTMVPIRLLAVAAHRRIVLGEAPARSLRVGVALTPTLVFTLVIAGILRDVFEVPQAVFGGLVIYTLGNTLIPGFALRAPPEFELHAPDLDPALDPQVTYRVPTGTHRVAAAEGAGASSVPPDSSVSRPTDAGAATG